MDTRKAQLLSDLCRLRAETKDAGDPHFELYALELEIAYAQRANLTKREEERIRLKFRIPLAASTPQASVKPPASEPPRLKKSDLAIRRQYERYCVLCDTPLTQLGMRFVCERGCFDHAINAD